MRTDRCSIGGCKREPTTIIKFIDGKRYVYCAKCARKIGGEQTPLAES